MIWIPLALACTRVPDRTVVVVSVVGGTSTSTTTTTSTTSVTTSSTTPTTTTTTTTTTVPEPGSPEIGTLTVAEQDQTLEVTVRLVPGDAPLDGGALTVDFDGAPLVLAIPDDLVSFVGETAVFTLDRPRVGECSPGADHDLVVSVTDADGRTSDPVDAGITTADQGIIVDEIGDRDAELLFLLPSGTRICGELDGTGNDGTTYTADIDLVGFAVDPTGPWALRLDWDVVADYDLQVYESNGGLLTLVDESAGPALHGPATVSTTLYRNTNYVFAVAGWDGDLGGWTVELQ